MNIISQILILDFPKETQIGFQDAATLIMYGIVGLHHHIMNSLIVVLLFVFLIFFKTYNFSVYFDYYKISNILWNISYDTLLNYAYSNIPASMIYTYQELDHMVVEPTRLSYFNLFLFNNFKLIKWYKYNVSHGVLLEIIWTFIPSFILLTIVGPSFNLLYAMDSCLNPDITIKVIGHQWYWTFEYTDAFTLLDISKNINAEQHGVFDISVDSYMLAVNDLSKGDLRLLEVDNPLYIPSHTKVRLDITASDVIHAFAVPSLGVKVDAIPGRVNVAYLEIIRNGVYFGQCSELCGVNHGFMPIKIIVTDTDNFLFNIMLHFNIEYFWMNNICVFKTNFLKNII